MSTTLYVAIKTQQHRLKGILTRELEKLKAKNLYRPSYGLKLKLTLMIKELKRKYKDAVRTFWEVISV